jgi:hypothetical protein
VQRKCQWSRAHTHTHTHTKHTLLCCATPQMQACFDPALPLTSHHGDVCIALADLLKTVIGTGALDAFPAGSCPVGVFQCGLAFSLVGRAQVAYLDFSVHKALQKQGKNRGRKSLEECENRLEKGVREARVTRLARMQATSCPAGASTQCRAYLCANEAGYGFRRLWQGNGRALGVQASPPLQAVGIICTTQGLVRL